MNYTFNQLKIFLEVAEKKSITKAALSLHLTQPAVSIQLKNFQDQFDVPLIEVINKKIFITDFGKEIVSAAKKILEEMHAINYKMHAYKGELTGKLKFSIVSTGKYIAPYFIADFINKHKSVELLLDVTNKAQVLDSLEKNEIDFALVSVLPENIAVEKIELMENSLYLVGNKNANQNAKSYKKQNDKSIFKELPIIFREEGSGTRYVMEKFIKKNNLPIIKKLELTSNEAVKQAVIAGLGYSIMPLIGIRNELDNNQLQIINVKGFPIKSKWYLIWLKEKKLTPLSSSFLSHIKKEKDRIIADNFSI